MKKVKITKKPWGEEHLFAHRSKYAGKLLFINKGHRLSLQFHNRKEETFYVMKGRLRMLLETDGKRSVRVYSPGAVIHIPPKTIHRTEAVSSCCLIEVSTPELDDIVRLNDDYNRK